MVKIEGVGPTASQVSGEKHTRLVNRYHRSLREKIGRRGEERRGEDRGKDKKQNPEERGRLDKVNMRIERKGSEGWDKKKLSHQPQVSDTQTHIRSCPRAADGIAHRR